jgi:uncharacterized membrane protein YfcA
MIALIALLALFMGSVLGLLGGGGSILTVPILAYVAGMPAGEAIASSLVVVGLTSVVGAANHAKRGGVEWKTGLIFGGVAMVGAFAGGRLAVYVPGWLLLALFAALMVTTSVIMLRKSNTPANHSPSKASIPMIVIEGFLVGAVTGLVGAGGGFLVVPALVILGGLPMHKAIGTSLLVIAMKSVAGVAGHLTHVDINWGLTLTVAGFAIVGSIVGARYSSKIPANTLRVVFAWFVLIMGTFILSKELLPFLGATVVYPGLAVAGLGVAAFAYWQSHSNRNQLGAV